MTKRAVKIIYRADGFPNAPRMNRRITILPSSQLERVRYKIKRDWLYLDTYTRIGVTEGVIHCYINRQGSLAEIAERIEGRRQLEAIMLANATLRGLQNTARRLTLPFETKKVMK